MTLEAAIDRITEDFLAASQRGDPDACASFYTNDAEIHFMFGRIARGREAIRQVFAAGNPIAELKTVWTESCDDFGCCMQFGRGPDDFKVLLALRRQTDGRWLVVRELMQTI